MRPILQLAKERLGIGEEHLEPYGRYKAKISLNYLNSLKDRPDGKLVLVTAISPTPAGEGKTTTTVGLGDALNRIGKKTMVCLREPALGPVFGMKGGAAGGGFSQVVPMEDINLHFTGDFGAIQLANNLLAALIDNHVYHGNALGFDVRRISWRRVVDVNDRALARHHRGTRRHRQWLSAPGRLRHRGRLRSDGDLLPGHEPGRSEGAARQYRGRLYPRAEADPRPRSQGARRHDGVAQGRARAQPGADAGKQSGANPRRTVRQYRSRLQFRDRHQCGPQARRLRGHRGRVRRGPGRGKIHRHQVPQGRTSSPLPR